MLSRWCMLAVESYHRNQYGSLRTLPINLGNSGVTMKRLKTHRGHPDFTTRVVRPKISIITTVYNILPAIFRQCFESVLKQASLYWELTLCDDASTNAGTLEVLSHFQGFDSRIQVVRNSRNLHIADSSNRAVYIGTKEFVALSAPEL